MQGSLCAEILHTGPFDEEPASFAKMDSFIEEHSLKRLENCHREIYLNNAKRPPKKQAQNDFALFGGVKLAADRIGRKNRVIEKAAGTPEAGVCPCRFYCK